MNDRVLGVIPARGGSKRIPGKNLEDVAGKPLIAHTIEQAKQARALSRTIVSTDDEAIAAEAREYGADVPFERPEELATDTAKTREVVTHALEWFEDRGESFDAVCKLQPTSPLRTAEDIDGTVDELLSSDAQSVLSVCEYVFPPEWSLTETDDGYLTEHLLEGYLWQGKTRSQDTSTPVCPNGAVMVATADAWHEFGTFYTDRTRGYEMPTARSFDVDVPRDLELVRTLLED